MARSYYHTPAIVSNTTAVSEKEDKQKANRRLRRKVNADTERNAHLTLDDVSSVWTFAKDGKRFSLFYTTYSEDYRRIQRVNGKIRRMK